ncbi:MAG: response regulator [Pseudomonadota bacterium]
MEKAKVVLVDMTRDGADSSLARIIERHYPLLRVSKSDDVRTALASGKQVIACFEYDYPDVSGLSVLSDIKRDFASVPVMMFTKHHSEALAVWALRARVWNYFVKPVSPETVLPSLAALAGLVVGADL